MLTDLNDIKKRIYFSQNREDLILSAFFPDQKKGFYVDIGAFDPDIDSVTKLFYLRGWHGINIEPQPDRIKYFLTKRKRDINLGVGVSVKKGELLLRSYDNQGLSTFSKNMKDSYDNKPEKGTESYEDLKITVERLDKILMSHRVSSIQFMKIDVEGYEYEVLQSNDWEKFRPEVICIESNHIVNDWKQLLEENDYELVFNDGLNDYYVDSRTNRAEKFHFVNTVVLGALGGIRNDDYERISELNKQLSSLLVENNRAMQDVNRLSRISEEQEQLILNQKIELNSTKQTFMRLLRLFKRRLGTLR